MSLLVEATHTATSHDPGRERWEHLDSSRCEIIELCGETGKMIFRFLLEISTLSPGRGDMAVCPLKCLQDIATQLHASPDTIKRYVAVFRAINLVSHYHDQRRSVKLYIPLGPYRPLTNFVALDELLGKRKKLRDLAQKVKVRYMTRFGNPTQAYSDEVRTTFQDLSAILENEHLDPLKRQRLQMKIADLLTQLIGTAGASMGDLNATLGHLPATSSSGVATSRAGEGDSNEGQEVFCSAKKPIQGKETSHEGDLNLLKGDFTPQEALSSRHRILQTGDSNLRQGDLTINTSAEVAHQSEQMGDSKTEKGDPMPPPSVQPDQTSELQHTKLGDSNLQQGDPRVHTFIHKRERISPHQCQKGDSNGDQGDLDGRNESSVGDSNESPVHEEGDLSSQFSSLSINDIENNILYISSSKNDTFIDSGAERKRNEPTRETSVSGSEQSINAIQREATALALFLDQTTANVASCVKKLKENPMAVRAGVVDVLYHEHFPDYRGMPKKRGAWFNTAYTRYRQPHVIIPAEIARWLQSTASWTDIEDALMQEERKAATEDGSLSSSIDAEDHPALVSSRHSHESSGLPHEGGSQSSVERREDHRTDEQRKARQARARQVRRDLQQIGVVTIGRDGRDGLAIEGEHRCGCPLYREQGLRRQCAHCVPDGSWDQEARDIIASILEA